MHGKTDPRCSGMIITDPSEIAFREAVRHLRSLAQAVLTPLLQALTNQSLRASFAWPRPMSSVPRGGPFSATQPT